MGTNWLVLAALVLPGGVAAGASPGPGAVEVALRLVRGTFNGSARPVWLSLGHGGVASHPFPTASGRLLLQAREMSLAVDRNGDGRIDAADGPAAGPRGFEVACRLGGREALYPVSIGLLGRDRLHLASEALLEGSAGSFRIRIADTDLDGRFGEVGEDLILVESEPGPAEAEEGGRWRPLPVGIPMSRILAVGGRLYTAKLDEAKWRLDLAPWAGEAGRLVVELPPGIRRQALRLECREAGLHASLPADQAELLVVPGRYRVVWPSLVPMGAKSRQEPAGAEGGAALRSDPMGCLFPLPRCGEAEFLEIRPGENRLRLGAPFRLEARASLWGPQRDQLEIEDVRLVGRGGDLYRPRLYGQAESAIQARLRVEEQATLLGHLFFEADGWCGGSCQIPAELAARPGAELILEFSAEGLEEVRSSWRLADLVVAEAPSAMAWRRLAMEVAESDPRRAMELYGEGLERFPEDPWLLNNFAWFLLTVNEERFRHPDAALALARRAMRGEGGRCAYIRDTLALALLRTGDAGAALIEAEQAVALDPWNEEIRRRLEEIRREAER